jgi:pimeloyl-ACP methyl ester carboxylesterase
MAQVGGFASAVAMQNGAAEAFESLFVTAPDGLRLHMRSYGTTHAPALPVVCLPGLARTAADFHELALGLAGSDRSRRVLALDYRGRGLSEYDRDPSNYNLVY